MQNINNLNIVAIGGGIKNSEAPGLELLKLGRELSAPETNATIYTLHTAENPNDEASFDKSVAVYNGYLRGLFASVVNVHGWKKQPTSSMLDELRGADAIFISGGKTRPALESWATNGLASVIISAAQAGVPLVGTSAGGIDPFVWGHSNPNKTGDFADQTATWDYELVKALGVVPNTAFCPHFSNLQDTHKVPRWLSYIDMLRNDGQLLGTNLGLGADEQTALRLTNGELTPFRPSKIDDDPRTYMIKTRPEAGPQLEILDFDKSIPYQQLLAA